ncbi:MAG: hypothetical protein GX879_11440, partial [Bacteroidales bacterium]|nr:hypothetical protein [Bacteroidales bacterium]
EENIYCYLDSDIVAINSEINTIFDEYIAPINFASDHCNMNQFSPHSMNCNCLETINKNEIEKKEKLNNNLGILFGKINFSSKMIQKQSDDLYYTIQNWKKNPIKNIFKIIRYVSFRYVLPVKELYVKNYRFDRKTRCWYNNENEIILFDYPYYEKELWNKAGLRYNRKNNYWEDKDGTVYIFNIPECEHLVDYLKEVYSVEIPGIWQHWNGGVFLFNFESKEFLDFWHNATIKEFDNLYTKTRDQFTLAMSAWKFGLQNHKRLDKKFNFITEFADANISYNEELGFTYDNFQTVFAPCFLHIYHEWGHKGWSIWDYVERLEKSENLV